GVPVPGALGLAGRVRLRPILMTTLCTLAGLAPLALGFGAGAELQRPLALAVVGGLTVSTGVTLLLLPVLLDALGALRESVQSGSEGLREEALAGGSPRSAPELIYASRTPSRKFICASVGRRSLRS